MRLIKSRIETISVFVIEYVIKTEDNHDWNNKSYKTKVLGLNQEEILKELSNEWKRVTQDKNTSIKVQSIYRTGDIDIITENTRFEIGLTNPILMDYYNKKQLEKFEKWVDSGNDGASFKPDWNPNIKIEKGNKKYSYFSTIKNTLKHRKE